MARKAQKLQISERALFARINRKIHGDELMLRRCPATSRDFPTLGDYYLVNLRINGVVGKDIDLEDYGRECGALKGYEELADD